jgi:dimethylargininase
MDMPSATHALVRDVPDTFDRAITPASPAELIDVERARQQHRRYCEVLEGLGLTLVRVAADDRFPDCPFVEDTALLLGGKIIITAPGAEARRGEVVAVEEALRGYGEVHRIEAPATLDGGDVLRIADALYVGLSTRTNVHAIEQLRAILGAHGYRIVPVDVRDVLHLKSACTYLGGDVIVWLDGHLDPRGFAHFRKIAVPRAEAHAANCLAVNRTVLVPSGAPQTRARIDSFGLDTVEVEMSETRKAGGGLTCSSVIFSHLAAGERSPQ